MTRATQRSLRRRTAESITAVEWDARAHTIANFMCFSGVCVRGLIVCVSAKLLHTRPKRFFIGECYRKNSGRVERNKCASGKCVVMHGIKSAVYFSIDLIFFSMNPIWLIQDSDT